MNTSESAAALEAELRVVKEDLARLRETAADLRRRIGEREDEPTDPAERAALIEAAEEQEALIDMLKARREELLRKLGRPGTGTGPVDRPLLSDPGLLDSDRGRTGRSRAPCRAAARCRAQSPQFRPDATTALVPYRPATVDGAGSG
jgi:hypothetical protein